MASSSVQVLLLVLVSVALLDSVLADVGFSASDLESDASISALFEKWSAKHGKSYRNSAEALPRLAVFKEKLFQIHAHNQQGHSYRLGLNQFSDVTQEEMEARFVNVKVSDLMKRVKVPAKRSSISSNLAAIPEKLDWRWKGAVTLIKDVGNCTGGTWTYAAAGAVEGSLKVNGNALNDLSAQQLLDCVTENLKCKFGNPAVALDYVLDNGITTQKLYPFTGANQSCKPLPSSVVTISDVERLYGSSDDTDLLNAVAQQPVAVLVDGSAPEFINYESGVYAGPYKNQEVNTALLIVGYDKLADGTPYWTVKNSWGFGWGEAGYMRIKRNAGGSLGMCNINAFPSYPIGAAPGSRPPPCGSGQTCPSGMTCCCREPAVGSKCTLYMCCPNKYSDCENGCCKEKSSSAFDATSFAAQNVTGFSAVF